jgi:arsenate reductase
MAEGLINHDFKGQIEAKSAGVMPCYVHPNTIKSLGELGIDITHHESQHVNDFVNERFDIVITLCDYAKSVCPDFHNADDVVHMPFDDPINAAGSEEDIMNEYRRVRDLLREQIGDFLSKQIKKLHT